MKFDKQTLIIAALAIAGFAGGIGVNWYADRPRQQTGGQEIAGLLWPNPRSVTGVNLIDQDGKPFTDSNLQGQWSLVFFGFTRCPDVCPTTMSVLKDAFAQMQRDPTQPLPRVIFISVDPERDTPEILNSYVGFFDRSFVGLTGNMQNVTALTRSLGIVYMKVPLEGDDYTVDHSAAILLLDPQARIVGLLSPPHTSADIISSVRQIQHFVTTAR
ncbi:MAG: SCO family protein [Gammaproteobacteria bacterium]|nr:SCO family protein [Gammaproteobacteria bacterium]